MLYAIDITWRWWKWSLRYPLHSPCIEEIKHGRQYHAISIGSSEKSCQSFSLSFHLLLSFSKPNLSYSQLCGEFKQYTCLNHPLLDIYFLDADCYIFIMLWAPWEELIRFRPQGGPQGYSPMEKCMKSIHGSVPLTHHVGRL